MYFQATHIFLEKLCEREANGKRECTQKKTKKSKLRVVAQIVIVTRIDMSVRAFFRSRQISTIHIYIYLFIFLRTAILSLRIVRTTPDWPLRMVRSSTRALLDSISEVLRQI